MKKNATVKTNGKVIVFDRIFYLLVFIFLIIIIGICGIPYLLTSPAVNPRLDFSRTGEIGDTISGTMGPFIAIAAALLTFIAFWVQFKANKIQSDQINKQATDASVERFENKFFELIRIQRENLNDIEIQYVNDPSKSLKGRRAFISMFYELRFIYYNVKKFIEGKNDKIIGFDSKNEEEILNIAYYMFFMGIGNNSDKLILASLSDKCESLFLKELINYLRINVKEKFRKSRDEILSVKLIDSNNSVYFSSKYIPLGGHLARLGHYYRHLYHTVKFIAEQNDEIIDEVKKCDYVRTLRAQLSDYEQLILFYNINSSLGKTWTDKKDNYIRRFRMIKNIPVPLADFAVLPKIRFAEEIEFWQGQGKCFFEWDERK